MKLKWKVSLEGLLSQIKDLNKNRSSNYGRKKCKAISTSINGCHDQIVVAQDYDDPQCMTIKLVRV